MTPAQSRMARAALEWTVDVAAKQARIGRMVILRFESDGAIDDDPQRMLNDAFVRAGIEFVAEGDYAGAVRYAPELLRASA